MIYSTYKRKSTKLIINQLQNETNYIARARPTLLRSIVYHLVYGAQVERVSAVRQLQRTFMINVNVYDCAQRDKHKDKKKGFGCRTEI